MTHQTLGQIKAEYYGIADFPQTLEYFGLQVTVLSNVIKLSLVIL